MATIPDAAAPSSVTDQDTRFDRRFSEILDYATEVFADKGYEGASMRDLSRLSGMSLAGLYYYFDSKEKLLYLIQKHTFTTIIDRLRQLLAESADPEERIRIFVHNHVEYALAKQKAMKVLSHEDDVLKNGHGAELAAIKREHPAFNCTLEIPAAGTEMSWNQSPMQCPPDHALVQALAEGQTIASGRQAHIGAHGRLGNVGDGNIIAEKLGIPTVQYGPGDIRIYKEWPTPDERVRLADLVTAARAVAHATVRLCGRSSGHAAQTTSIFVF